MAEETIVRTIEIRTEGAQKSLNEVEEATDSVAGSTGQLDENLGGLPGPLSKARAGVQALSKAFKALLANPIVLIIAAITTALIALGKAMTSTEAGADKLQDTMSGFRAIKDEIVSDMAEIGRSLIDAFKTPLESVRNLRDRINEVFDRSARENWDLLIGRVKDYGEALNDARKEGERLAQEQRAIFEAETDLLLVQAQRRTEISELVFVSRELNRTVEERREAILRADAIEKQILNDNIALQERRVQLVRDEIEATPENLRTREQERELAQQLVNLEQLRAQSLNQQRQLKNRLNTLDAEAARLAQARRDMENDITKIVEDRVDDMEIFADDWAALDKMMKDDLRELAQMDKALAAQRIENIKMLEDAERDAAAVRQQIAADLTGALINFVGAESAAGKALMVADATRAAIMAALQAYQSTSAIPVAGPVLAPIAAGAALAYGMSQVRAIAAIGPGTVPVPGVSLATPPTPPDSFEDFINRDQLIPQDVRIIQEPERTAARAYVVESEITAAQEVARKQKSETRL